MSMSVKLAITIFLVLSFAGVALLSFVVFHKNNLHHDGCPVTNAQGVACPTVAGGIASAVFYARAFGIFFTAVFLALLLTVLFCDGFFGFFKKKEPNIASLFFIFSFLLSLSKIVPKISMSEFVSWLAFHEQSPSLI